MVWRSRLKSGEGMEHWEIPTELGAERLMSSLARLVVVSHFYLAFGIRMILIPTYILDIASNRILRTL